MVMGKELKIGRDKSFSELSSDEKIEFLSRELRRTQQHLKTLSSTISSLLKHNHLNDQLVSRIEQPNEERYGGIFFRVEEFK